MNAAMERVMDAHQAYEQLRRTEGSIGGGLPGLKPRWWRATTEATVPFADAARALRECGPVEQGWLKCQRALMLVGEAGVVPDDDPILEGELLMADGSTVLLRPDGRGQVRILRHRDAAEAFDGAEPVLAQEIVHIATPAARGFAKLRYRVYLAIDDEHGALPRAYRFMGFEAMQGAAT